MIKESEVKIIETLKDHFGQTLLSYNLNSIPGSSLNEIYKVAFNDELIFCKVNSSKKFPQLFHKESLGLDFLSKNTSFKIPGIIGCIESVEQVLLMEWIEPAEKTETFWKNFGKQLAEMHLVSSQSFGWTENNYMGLVPQSNRLHKTWSEFFREERLEPLCRLCSDKGFLHDKHLLHFNKLYNRLADIFPDDALPSLVHGDLWNGNFIAGKNNNAVLIDPAVYFGHPSVDLGMSTLFGGFPGMFYDSYQYYLPFPSNYRQQWKIVNLYPLLIHLYLFGQSYLNDINQTLLEFE